MDEGQVVRWKYALSGTGGLQHDHTSDHITHKTLGYQPAVGSDGPDQIKGHANEMSP